MVIYIKENIIIELQKSYSLHRNVRVGNKLTVLFLKKYLCTGDLSPAWKIFIERPVGILCMYTVYVSRYYIVYVCCVCIWCMYFMYGMYTIMFICLTIRPSFYPFVLPSIHPSSHPNMWKTSAYPNFERHQHSVRN